MKSFSFSVEKKIKDGKARAGKIQTPHGDIMTPAFIPVATKATVKSLLPEEVKRAGAQAVLANTYHLYLQPGDELVKEAGGLHKFMNWGGPIITDSGGFQVFSLGVAYGKEISKITKTTDPNLLIPERADDERLPKLAKIGADGVSFKSHLDGSTHYITPEKSIEIQHNLGADIIFAFDECTSPTENDLYQEEALNRTHRWAKRSLEHHKKLLSEFASVSRPSALFGIVQGGRNEALRKKSAKILSEMTVQGNAPHEAGSYGKSLVRTGFDGFGIGGSFAKEDMSTVVKWVNDILPEDKPRHLLGIGEPEDLFMGVENGVDLFDCVLPTRLGRNGTIFTKKGKIHITNAKFTKDFSPIEDSCSCYTCSLYSKAYISYLFKANEMIAGTLATIHNLHFIVHLVEDMRRSIFDGSLELMKKKFLKSYIIS
ncbi:MAG: tRNA-guanine(34) transglycosylase [Candidatus Zambryskibacteria bacterium CG_4_9_14_3_um_filter_40_16]|uniref:Queuine tRNA-ribosyltransferase n=2 Tax=Candidatus Zambryskiibacteriota TaxID=1817925 RepID=A0A2H0K6S9_9BACT|nr:MAG: tRNA-guanine(34) transglycosylase [Candidatus Zambryskibacteria bacterium CG11_big_fil_rev_8_21_14_0_20_40_24]PJA33846.1 MAG: tRNA-guanine(34) transglycosylase [Candidatus Zambryskibacteria bacterium CG_4_9_14_3_um_filter_40_16]